jgi:hypothetical protein
MFILDAGNGILHAAEEVKRGWNHGVRGSSN